MSEPLHGYQAPILRGVWETYHEFRRTQVLESCLGRPEPLFRTLSPDILGLYMGAWPLCPVDAWAWRTCPADAVESEMGRNGSGAHQ